MPDTASLVDPEPGVATLVQLQLVTTSVPQATPTSDAEIRTAALKFLRWAHTHSLLSTEAYYPGDGFEPPVFEHAVTGEALAVLRSKHIRFVGINPAGGQIVVYLQRVAPAAKQYDLLPKTVDGYQLRFVQGEPNGVNPQNVAEASDTSALYTNAAGNNFYTCGSSISVGNSRAAGTLGCLLTDMAGKLYGLSNNHVSASCGYAPAGMPIIAPGVLDVHQFGPRPFTIGVHSRQLDLSFGDPSSVDTSQNQDAAVFELVSPGMVSSMQRTHYDTPMTVGDMVPGMLVEKVGRTSDFTIGSVQSETVGPLGISYAVAEYQFSGSAYLEPLFIVHGIGDRFSEGGDSGALVTHVDAAGVRTAVGIVVAGANDSKAPGGKLSFVMAIRPILNKLALNLVSNHNV